MKYHVEVYRSVGGNLCLLRWMPVPFAESNTRAYCEGYVDAMDSLYPSAKYRIMKGDEVLRETNGHAYVSV